MWPPPLNTAPPGTTTCHASTDANGDNASSMPQNGSAKGFAKAVAADPLTATSMNRVESARSAAGIRGSLSETGARTSIVTLEAREGGRLGVNNVALEVWRVAGGAD